MVMINKKREWRIEFCEGNSTVECQLPKLNAAGSIPVPRFMLFLFLMISLYFISGCASTGKPPSSQIGGAVMPQGIYHKVRQGETIWRIAKMYNVPVEDIVQINKIPNAARIEKNQLVLIPGAKGVKEIVDDKSKSKANEFDWPLKGKIISYFGTYSDSRVNNGVDIQSDVGEKVLASRDGKVVFADYLNGYGDTIILDHLDDFFTVYSENSMLLVKVNDTVSKGTPIAQVGKNGDLAFLHFEIRKNAVATNPLYYLP